MNSKQRKIANKMRERAELDCSAQVRELEYERSKFEELKAGTHKEFTRLAEKLSEERRAWKKQSYMCRSREARYSSYMKAKQQKFRDDQKNLEGVNVLREVILMLELDEEPAQIALNLRQQYGLLIPEW